VHRNKFIFIGDKGDKFYIILKGIGGVFVPKDSQRIQDES
jgi:hypothetical protein